MKNKNQELSRRNFIAKGAAATAAASILVIPALSADKSKEMPLAAKNTLPNALMMTNDPVYTDSAQTLTNKKIPSRQNILGTDYINVREYLTGTSTDITSALNAAITDLSSYPFGGQILIPHGVWTTDGGHDIPDSISIEGVGYNANPGYGGTELRLNADKSSYMFKFKTERRNCSIKNLAINLSANSAATGLLMTNAGSSGLIIYFTCVENVFFYAGAYGIKVDSVPDSSSNPTNFECILNRFERVSFIGCRTAFYCNSVNGGYTFDNCYFSVPPPSGSLSAGTALEVVFMGNLTLDHCLFVGVGAGPNVPVTDGTTVLRTTGAFNNISFYDCQDEGLQYMYQNTVNAYDYVSLIWRSCLIQSHFKFTANGAMTLDNCRNAGTVYDTSTAYARVYLRGLNNFYTSTNQSVDLPTSFSNAYSQVIYDAREIGKPVITPTGTTGYQVINASRGTINIAAGNYYVQVYNNYVTPNSLVFAQLRSYDSGGAKIRNVYNDYGYFVIYLDKNAASELSIGFTVEAY